MSEIRQPEADYFFEVSYEVANKIGGIYQVLSSKARSMLDYYGDNYYTIGYFDPEKSKVDFQPQKPGKLKKVFEELADEGINCYYGKWDVPGKPNTILVDPADFSHNMDRIKGELWEEYGIDSINAGNDFDDPVLWSYSVGKLLNKLNNLLNGKKVFQFHEWLSGTALLKLRSEGIDSGLVFTTHATILGRTMSTSPDVDLLKMIKKGLDSGKSSEDYEEDLASKYGVKAKHMTEKLSSMNSNVFTTVSDTTAREAKFILGREPDILTYNGMDIKSLPSMEEISYQHKKYKDRIKEFLAAYFRPYYGVNLEEDPRVLFISGRYEFGNKGIDVFIEALGELNQKLKEEKYDRDIFVFFFIPSDTRGGKMEVLENISIYNELEDYVEDITPDLKRKMISLFTQGKDIEEELPKFLNENYGKSIKSFSKDFQSKKGKKPPTCAFELNYENDDIQEALRSNHLTNKENDPVKVIQYPAYLSVSDKFLSLDYYPAIRGCSLGVFPSKYEPWGYTPVESASNGNVAVTTDLAGFGKFLLKNCSKEERDGIYLLERENKSKEEVVEQLKGIIDEVVHLSGEEIISKKHNARKISHMTSWGELSKKYIEAHNKALKQ